MFKRIKQALKAGITLLFGTAETSRLVWKQAEKERQIMLRARGDVTRGGGLAPFEGVPLAPGEKEELSSPPYKGISFEDEEDDGFEPFEIEPAEYREDEARARERIGDAVLSNSCQAEDIRAARDAMPKFGHERLSTEQERVVDACDDDAAEGALFQRLAEPKPYSDAERSMRHKHAGKLAEEASDEAWAERFKDKEAQEVFADAVDELLTGVEKLGWLVQEAELDKHEEWHNGHPENGGVRNE